MKQIVFLLYMNRSGSTYLARLLNQNIKVGVTLEGTVPDGVADLPNILRKFRSDEYELTIINERELKKYINELYRDEKFNHWGIERNLLEKKLSKLPMPIHYREILFTILDLYFAKYKIDVYVYKKGSYIFSLEYIDRLFPDAKFIFILRDLRAIYNSQKNTLDTKRNWRMAYSPYETSKIYNKVLDILNKWESKSNFLIVKYENFIGNSEKELNRIYSFLKVPKINDGEKEYYSNIPIIQRSIHENIILEPLIENISNWKYSLSNHEIKILQKKSGKQLERWGYEIMEQSATGIFARFYIIIYILRKLQRKLYWYIYAVINLIKKYKLSAY